MRIGAKWKVKWLEVDAQKGGGKNNPTAYVGP